MQDGDRDLCSACNNACCQEHCKKCTVCNKIICGDCREAHKCFECGIIYCNDDIDNCQCDVTTEDGANSVHKCWACDSVLSRDSAECGKCGSNVCDNCKPNAKSCPCGTVFCNDCVPTPCIECNGIVCNDCEEHFQEIDSELICLRCRQLKLTLSVVCLDFAKEKEMNKAQLNCFISDHVARGVCFLTEVMHKACRRLEKPNPTIKAFTGQRSGGVGHGYNFVLINKHLVLNANSVNMSFSFVRRQVAGSKTDVAVFKNFSNSAFVWGTVAGRKCGFLTVHITPLVVMHDALKVVIEECRFRMKKEGLDAVFVGGDFNFRSMPMKELNAIYSDVEFMTPRLPKFQNWEPLGLVDPRSTSKILVEPAPHQCIGVMVIYSDSNASMVRFASPKMVELEKDRMYTPVNYHPEKLTTRLDRNFFGA